MTCEGKGKFRVFWQGSVKDGLKQHKTRRKEYFLSTIAETWQFMIVPVDSREAAKSAKKVRFSLLFFALFAASRDLKQRNKKPTKKSFLFVIAETWRIIVLPADLREDAKSV